MKNIITEEYDEQIHKHVIWLLHAKLQWERFVKYQEDCSVVLVSDKFYYVPMHKKSIVNFCSMLCSQRICNIRSDGMKEQAQR